MFGIGSTELLVILLVALIVLGPKSLAKFAKSLGKAMGEFRKVSTDFQRTLNFEAAQDDIRAKEEAYKKRTAKKEDLNNIATTTAAAPEDKPAPPSSGQKTESPVLHNFPPDSPVARAIAKAQAEANAAHAPDIMEEVDKKVSEVQKSGESHA